MGSQVTRVMGFLPANFHFLRPSVIDSGSGTGQTDRQTDGRTDNGHHCITPPHYGSDVLLK